MQRYGSHPHMPPRLHCHCSILLIRRTYYSSFFSPISSSSTSHLLVVVFSASPRNFPFRGGGGRKTPLSLSFTPDKPLGTNLLLCSAKMKTVLDYCDGSRSSTEAHRDGSWILKKAAGVVCFFFFFLFWFVFSNQSLTLQPSETREHEEQTQRECREWNRERSLFFEHWIWVRGRIRTSEADNQRERDQE